MENWESRQADDLWRLHETLDMILPYADLETLSQQLIQAVVQIFGHSDCGLMILDKDHQTIRRLARGGQYDAQPQEQLMLDGPGLVPEAMRQNIIIYAPDVTDDPRYVVGDARTRSELVVPLVGSYRLVGALDLQHEQVDAFSEGDLRLLSMYARTASYLLENALLYAEMEAANAVLQERVALRTAELARAIRRVEAILNNSSSSIVLARADGSITQTNPAFDRLFGYSIDETYGWPLVQLFLQDDVPLLVASLRRLKKTSQPEHIILRAMTKAGNLLYLEVGLAPLEDGDHRGIVCNMHDISDAKYAEEQMRLSLERERQLREMKSRFVSTVSHEFRTPLASIQMIAGNLERYWERLDEAKRLDKLRNIQQQTVHMSQLMEDVLSLSRLEADMVPLKLMALDMVQLCKSVAAEYLPLYENSHHVDWHIGADIPTVEGDENLLRIMLNNIMSNAFKYSPEGGAVGVSITADARAVMINISDEGIGIPEDEFKHIFMAFHRAKNVQGLGGTGLGLAIVQRIAERHKGYIAVKSDLGQGTEVTVVLPYTSEGL
ncbi:MAG: ATP-binding protein [Anaerolineales bacterium]